MVMRIGGIASGFDTEQMLTDMMRVERMKVDKLFRQEEALRWKREALNTTNKTLADFILKARSDFGLSRTSNTGLILSSSSQNFDWVKKVSSSDDSVLDATASATAMEGNYTIDVKELASVANVMSKGLKEEENSVLNSDNTFKNTGSFTIETSGGKKATINVEGAKLTGKEIENEDLKFSGDNELTIRINGKEIGLNRDFTDIDDLVSYLNDFQDDEGNKVLGELGITVGKDENQLVFSSNKDIVIESSDADSDGNLKLSKLGLKNGLTKAVNSIGDVVKQINNAVDENGKSLGLKAAYDSKLGKLMITTKDQGEKQTIKITDKEGALASNIFGADSKVMTEGVSGNDAEFLFNGNQIKQSSNNFSMFGVNYNLKAKGITTVNVETDIDGIYNKVKDFVDEYNDLVDKLNGLVNEKSYRDYRPLTSEEKEAMKEKEIELWEEKAKSGLLRNDETINRMLQTMRSGLYENVHDGDGKLEGFYHITQIGISTGNYQSGGKLEINEEKLRKAIIDDADGVMNLLFKKSDISAPSGNTPADRQQAAERRKTSGLVDRLFDDMIGGMKDIVRRAGPGEDAGTLRNVQSNMLIDFVTKGSISVMDRDIMDIGKRIAREEMFLSRKEQRYWDQFTAMEKALEQMNQQAGWLMSQLGQMGM